MWKLSSLFKSKNKMTNISKNSGIIPRKIILIDDDKVSLELSIEYLKDLKFEIVAFQDSLDAYNYLDKTDTPESILCVISDLMMESIDGIDLFELVKIKKNYKYINFIFSTSADESLISNYVLEYSNTFFLKKPVNQKTLELINFLMKREQPNGGQYGLKK